MEWLQTRKRRCKGCNHHYSITKIMFLLLTTKLDQILLFRLLTSTSYYGKHSSFFFGAWSNSSTILDSKWSIAFTISNVFGDALILRTSSDAFPSCRDQLYTHSWSNRIFRMWRFTSEVALSTIPFCSFKYGLVEWPKVFRTHPVSHS